jgi:hypothetical protein
MTMAADTPTVVLVHGAWADATGFGGVIRALRERGFPAVGAANPLRHLTADAEYLADLLRSSDSKPGELKTSHSVAAFLDQGADQGPPLARRADEPSRLGASPEQTPSGVVKGAS